MVRSRSFTVAVVDFLERLYVLEDKNLRAMELTALPHWHGRGLRTTCGLKPVRRWSITVHTNWPLTVRPLTN